MTPWWWRGASHPSTPWVLLVLGLALGAPAFGVGLLFEDWGQRWMLSQPTFDPLAPFRLARDASELRDAQAMGIAPWWSDPGLRLAFLRPLSAATHRLDWTMWPDHHAVHVVHTFAWWALAAFAAWRVYLRLLPSRAAAALATFAWAADDARGTAVGWLANRNTLVAAAFGLGALALHLRGRATKEAWTVPVAVVMVAAALFSAEAGVGAVVWLVVSAVVLERDLATAARTLLPYSAAVVPWVLVWKGLGFGAARSGAYVDPLSEPLAWLVAALVHGPLDYAAQWSGPIATAASMTASPLHLAWWGVAVGVCAAVAVWARPLAQSDGKTAALAWGSVMALAPVVAVFPSERVLAFVGFGASGLVARALHDLATAPGLAPRPHRIATRVLAVLALVVGPVGLPAAIWANVRVLSLSTAPWDAWTPAEDPTGRDVVSLTAPCSMCSGYLVPYRAMSGGPVPARWRVVAPAWDEVTVARTGPATLSVTTAHGIAPPPGAASEWYGWMGPHVLAQRLDATFQDWRDPFPVGTVVDVGVFTVTVDALTADGRPRAVTLTFPDDLDHSDVVFVRYTDGRMVDVAPPRLGEARTFAPEPVPFDAPAR